MRAMILAAGLGTRLRPITFEIAKPMAPVLGRPVMAHICDLLHDHGFERVVANLSHLPEQIQDHFGDGATHGIELIYSVEQELLGTAGGVRNVARELGDSFLVISGDAVTDIDLTTMRSFHESHGGIATLAVKRVADTSQYGVVIAGDDGRVQGFQEKPDPAEALSEVANCGIYMFRAEIFEFFPAEPFADWAMDVFPALLEGDVAFYAHETDAYWNDIGSLDEYRQSNFDALAGAVHLHNETPLIDDGVFCGQGSDLSGADIEPPVFVGANCELGEGVRLHGPVVIDDGCQIEAGATLRDCVILPDSHVAANLLLAGAILGTKR